MAGERAEDADIPTTGGARDLYRPRVAEPLKHFFSKALVKRLGASLKAVHGPFDVRGFERDATRGLEALELLARAKRLADAMHRHLPADFRESAEILLRSLGPVHATDELEGAGMAPFFYLPHTIFVAEHGLEHFELSMTAQHALTQRFTCEFSIRAFLAHAPERTLAVLERWTEDPSPHVRRLVSEGTRPRLPWARRVKWLEENPERVLPLLERLKDDPTTLVRRSVANHLNDLCRTHRSLLLDTVERWMEGGANAPDDARRALVRHALRGAVKKGDPRALALLGFGERARVEVEGIHFEPPRVRIGEGVRVSFTLVGRARKTQRLAVDLAVHFVKARGQTGEKVFKLDEVELSPDERVTLGKRVSLAVHTTRTPRPGRHAVEALVNGQRLPLGHFEVV